MTRLWAFFPAALWASCIEVEGPWILASHLSGAAPAFALLPPDARIAPSPLPGSPRFLRETELRKALGAHGVFERHAGALCAAYAGAPIDSRALAAAIRAVSGEATIEIVDFTPGSAPRGEIVLPLSGLQAGPAPAPDSVVYWRGHIRYAATREHPIFLRARIYRPKPVLVARRYVRANERLAEDAAEVRNLPLFFNDNRWLEEIAGVDGKITKRPLRAGEPIARDWLTDAPLVVKGRPVRIRITSGGATLLLPGRAENSGGAGDRVSVRSTLNGKMIRAVVEGENLVWLQGS